MPYVDIIKDFSGVSRKVVFGLTKRQLITIIAAMLMGLPCYFLTRPIIGLSAVFLMMALMIPVFLVGFYPAKDGIPIEKRLANFIRAKYIRPAKRPYRTETIYSRIELAAKIQEVIDDAAERENKKDKKARPIQRTSQKRKKKNSKTGKAGKN